MFLSCSVLPQSVASQSTVPPLSSFLSTRNPFLVRNVCRGKNPQSSSHSSYWQGEGYGSSTRKEGHFDSYTGNVHQVPAAGLLKGSRGTVCTSTREFESGTSHAKGPPSPLFRQLRSETRLVETYERIPEARARPSAILSRLFL